MGVAIVKCSSIVDCCTITVRGFVELIGYSQQPPSNPGNRSRFLVIRGIAKYYNDRGYHGINSSSNIQQGGYIADSNPEMQNTKYDLFG